jgi:hypothetical protein
MSYGNASSQELTKTRPMRDAEPSRWRLTLQRLVAAVLVATLAGGAFPDGPRAATAAPPDPASRPPSNRPNVTAAAQYLAGRHGGSAGDYRLVYERQARIATSGEAVWVGKLVSARDGRLRTVYRDPSGRVGGPQMVLGMELAMAARISAFERKASPALRAAVGRGFELSAHKGEAAPLAVAAWLQVDLDAAEASVTARHPEVEWLGARPVVGDLATARSLRRELWEARRDAIASAAAAFRRDVERRGGRVAYVSTSAPLVFLDIGPAAVPGLAARPDVATLGLEGRWRPAMATARKAVEGNWTAGSGDRGNGVRVAVVEYHNVRERGDLARKVVRKHSTDGKLAFSGGFDHPTWVAGAIAGQSRTWRGVAPGARIVSSGTGGYRPSLAYDRAIIAAADWAISPRGGNADIINTSLVQDTAIGAKEARRYFDSIVDRDGRLAVSAAGNYVNFNSWAVGSPGTGYNVLTVGGVNDRGTGRRSDDRIWYVPGSNGANWLDRSSDPWNAHGDYNKPNLVAPAVNVRTANGLAASGTSVATPIVAGVAAQVLANEPALATWPEGTRAVLMAGAIHRVRMPNGSRNVDHEGVGMISARWANRAAHAGDNRLGGYRLGQLTAGEEPVQEIAVRAGDRLRVALAWNSHTSGSGNLNLRDRLRADLDLRVTDPDGRVAGSYTIDNANEFVEIKIQRSGVAHVQILQARFDGPAETYGLAWVKVRETTSPSVSVRVPRPEEPWAVPSARIRAKFSEPVEEVSETSVRLLHERSGERVPATVSYSSGTRTARLSPAQPLAPGRYRVVLRSAITDRAGNPLRRTHWTFRVKDPAAPVTQAFEIPRRVRLAPGAHVGYRFDGSGRVADSRGILLAERSTAHAVERRTMDGAPGVWLLLSGKGLDGYWVRESGGAGLRGRVAVSSWAKDRRVVLRSGTHVGYQYGAGGRITSKRASRLERTTTARTSARAVINGRWHLRITSGRWDGSWIPESRRAFIRRPFGLTDLGGPDARVAEGQRTGYRYNSDALVIDKRSMALANPAGPPARAWAIVNGRPSLYIEAGGWAGYWLPETRGVHLP